MPTHDNTWVGEVFTPSTPDESAPEERYLDRGRIAMGGMSEIRRVWDQKFGFHAAMKLLRFELLGDPMARARFDIEAALVARMQHPGIVAVYDQGESANGRPWFTMTEVRGFTFDDVIDEAHADGELGSVDLQRLVGQLLRVAETLAYAHSQGVVHRDLKPANLMVGRFGEVLVMDWGIARVVNTEDASSGREFVAPSPGDTGVGAVVGTPAYMAPEQAHGEQAGFAADVYALGGVLYHILTGGPPDTGPAYDVWVRLLQGPPTLFADTTRPAPPEELQVICRQAMVTEPTGRFANASAFAEAIRAWLDGARRRSRAQALLDTARVAQLEVQTKRTQAQQRRAEAADVLNALRQFDPVERKRVGWALEDQAADLEREVALAEVQWIQTVRAALTSAPDFAPAHEELAAHYAARLMEAETSRKSDDAARYEALLRVHNRGRHTDILRGLGALTVVTDPPGARALLYRYEMQDRRLVPILVEDLGFTPVIRRSLPQGSYLLGLVAEGCAEVRYPVFVERGQHWDGVRPGDAEPWPIQLPALNALGPDDCYVPAGWFISGGDPLAVDSLRRRRVWVGSFVIRRFPVTIGEYLSFLNDAAQHQEVTALLPLDSASCTFHRRDGPSGPIHTVVEPHRERWPVAGISWHAAQAFAQWAGWRLAHELEWEKAARGVDGRACAWGHRLEPTWACVVGHADAPPRPYPVDSFPIDESPYGVRGTVGNIRDWCANAWTREGPRLEQGRLTDPGLHPLDSQPYRSARGGAWTSTPAIARATQRFADPPEKRFTGLGFRLTRSL